MKDIEQRVAIKLMVKMGKKPIEIRQLLREMYGEKSMGKATVYTWIKRFSEGRTNVIDNERTGRPTTARTYNSVDKVKGLVQTNPRRTLRNMMFRMSISKGTIARILRDDLGLTYMSHKWVIRTLDDDQKQHRLMFCRDMLEHSFRDSIINNIVTGDGYIFSHYTSDSNMIRIKFYLICFFDKSGIIHHEYLSEEEMNNKNVYVRVLQRLKNKISQERPEIDDKWILYHSNVPTHTCLTVQKFLAEESITAVEYPSFWADLAPFDYFFVHKLHNLLKGKQFDSRQDAEDKLDKVLRMIPKISGFLEAFEELPNRWESVIKKGGDYYVKEDEDEGIIQSNKDGEQNTEDDDDEFDTQISEEEDTQDMEDTEISITG
nr:unnamed protein product [Callosobruchus analis]